MAEQRSKIYSKQARLNKVMHNQKHEYLDDFNDWLNLVFSLKHISFIIYDHF